MDFKFIKNFKNEKSAGFTIIELVVVLAIFVIVIDATVVLFISIVKHQKRILLEQELLSQSSYAIEYISRSLRGAKKDETGVCLQDGGTPYPGYIYLLTHYNPVSMFSEGVKFISATDDCKEFFLDGDGIFKEIKNGQPAQPLIADKFTVQYGRFVINGDGNLFGASENDPIQPRITILLGIQNNAPESQQEKIIQTTVSRRNIITIE